VSGERLSWLGKQLSKPLRWLQIQIRKLAAKLVAIEKSYAHKQKQTSNAQLNQQQLKAMVVEAEKRLDHGDYDAAEKLLVEVLSLDPKNLIAYETIGRLYIRTKNIAHAKESFKYLSKLAPQDASVLASLGEISTLEGNVQEAFTYFSRAKNISPNNPKYLDFFIEAALDKGDIMEATIAVSHLKEVNPENQKIEIFEKRIEETKSKRPRSANK
jgi:predicted Zn-dependent protease